MVVTVVAVVTVEMLELAVGADANRRRMSEKHCRYH